MILTMSIALGIEYDGSGFQGWQRLSHANCVQTEVESALSFVANEAIEVQCAGRTDAGVHAICQVVHFDSRAEREPRGWMLGANSRLPHAITVRWAVPVDEAFSARHSARARRYRYRILNRNVRPSLLRDYLAWERLPLDVDAMHRAAQALLGEHDFSAFRAAQCQATHAMREMQAISVRREGEQVVIDVRANAFLHHMVRNIVGSLLPIGRGEMPESWMGELLRGRDRTVAGATALPQGLTFVGPLYPAQWGLPAEATL
jgi:tRNA pseudouridine38-40 synthase